jgi:Calx-beta domain
MTTYRKSLLLFVMLLSMSFASSPAQAQGPDATIPLHSTQYKLNRLAPGITADQAVFSIDQSNVVAIEIITNIAGLGTEILGPGGQVINPSTVGGMGGSFTSLDGGSQQDATLILPSATPGFHYIYIFPWIGSGNYTVRYSVTTDPTQEVPIITQVVTDSNIRAKLFPTEPVLVLGNRAVLSAMLLNSTTPLSGADVSVSIKPETGPIINLVLRDDGAVADAVAGDGLYSGEFTPGALGKYEALALITGTATGGNTFARQSAAEFIVVPQTGKLTGIFNDQGVDDDGDGRFDRIAVIVQTNIAQVGKYRAFVHLLTKNGQKLVRSGEADLTAGTHNIGVNFEAAALLQLGENGPYTIELIELIFLDPLGANPADSLADVGQTQAYQLSQFQRPAVALTGVTSDQGVDDNANGKFDRLLVSIQVDVLRSGFYTWGFKLSNQNAEEIDFASGEAFFDVGLNNLNVSFDGAKIGAFGVNGPYQLRDLLVQGPGTSLVATDVGRTLAYQFTQFEGASAARHLQFDSAGYSVGEADARATITVTRTGDTTGQATVDYATSSPSGLTSCNELTGDASARCDYTAVGGTLVFMPGQTSRTLTVPIINDVYVEGTEVLTLTLSNPTGGVLLGTPSVATLAITDNDNTPGASNPIDNREFLLRQLYLDTLNREPEPAGLAAWLNRLNTCPLPGETLQNCDEIEVASAFFRSPEFFDRSYFIYKFYEAALMRQPQYEEFQNDLRRLTGFLTAQELEQRKQQFIEDFVNRSEFRALYDSFGSGQPFVDAVLARAGSARPGLGAATILPSNRVSVIDRLGANQITRGQALRELMESPEMSRRFFNKAFVVVGYFSFLRRNPDAAYLNWINMLNMTGDYREMIRGLLQSPEHRSRFGQ